MADSSAWKLMNENPYITISKNVNGMFVMENVNWVKSGTPIINESGSLRLVLKENGSSLTYYYRDSVLLSDRDYLSHEKVSKKNVVPFKSAKKKT